MKLIWLVLLLLLSSCTEVPYSSWTEHLKQVTELRNITPSDKFIIVDTGGNYCLSQNGSSLSTVTMEKLLNSEATLEERNLASWYLEESWNTFKIRNAATGCYLHAEYDSAVTVESILVGWWSAKWNIWINEKSMVWFTDRWRQNTVSLSGSTLGFDYTRTPAFQWKIESVEWDNCQPFFSSEKQYIIQNGASQYLQETADSSLLELDSFPNENVLWKTERIAGESGKEIYRFVNVSTGNRLAVNDGRIKTVPAPDSVSDVNWIVTSQSGKYTLRGQERNHYIASDSLGELQYLEQRDEWTVSEYNNSVTE